VTALVLPRLLAEGSEAATLVTLYNSALDNLTRINTVRDPGGDFFRAGGGYAEPWTRDASINSWFAGSLLDGRTAASTLERVTEAGPGGRILVQDSQWWDQAIWVIAAWNHFLTTGSRPFLRRAYGIARRSLALLRHAHFSQELGLYLGPGFMQDGISGLPTPPAETTEVSSFVLDYPGSWQIATLSTNAIYVGAYSALATMSALGGEDAAPAAQEAQRLTAAVREHFLKPDSLGPESPPYFVSAANGRVHRDPSLEAAGIALALLFDVFSPAEGRRLLDPLWREPAGVVNVWPHFADRYGDTNPGRHNVICWPVVMGLVNLASLKARDGAAFDRGFGDLSRLFNTSANSFFETYNARTGRPDGGWQSGKSWKSEPDQTWSATAFLASVHYGILGLSMHEDGLFIRPRLPSGIDSISVEGLRYRGAELRIRIDSPATASLGTAHSSEATIAATARGVHTIHLTAPHN
jgi:hypothetical protein